MKITEWVVRMSWDNSSDQTGGQQSQQQQRSQQKQSQQQQSQQQRQKPPASGAAGAREDASMPLLEGESILIDARPAWSTFAYQFLLAGLVLVGGIVVGDAAVILGVVVALGIVGYVWYKRRGIRYVVTDRRMMTITGHSSRATSEAWMVDVKNLKTGASFLERLLGHGHISVNSDITAGGLGQFSGMTFGGIENYEEIAQIIREQQNRQKMK